MLDRRAVAVAVALLMAGTGTAGAQVRAGAELQVNSYTTNYQVFPAVAVEPDGDFVVAWVSFNQDGSAPGVFAQRYDRTGASRGGEFRVNSYTTSFQNYIGRPGIGADRRGEFVVAWASYRQDGSGWGVFAQRFSSNGATKGAEFQVNTYTTGYQGSLGPYSAVSVGMDPRGNFVVVWASYQAGPDTEIFGQRFDFSGIRVGGEFQVNTTTLGYQGAPDVAMNAAGAFVVAWSGPDGSFYGAWARRFSASGSPLGADFRVNTYTSSNQTNVVLAGPTVALADTGSFVVAWDSLLQDGSASGVFGQIRDAAGAPSGAEFQVNTYTTYSQGLSTLAADPLGNFVVTWESGQDGSTYGVFAQRFTPAGALRGAEFRVNTYTTDFQGVSEVDTDEVGNFVVAWHGANGRDLGSPPSLLGVSAQRFGGLFPTALRVETSGNGVLDPGEAADVRPTWLNATGAVTAFTGLLGGAGGPVGGVPVITDANGSYGAPANNAAVECVDCYALTVPIGNPRPIQHWDATVVESILPDVQGQKKLWRLHVGRSFTDVPATNPFYRFIETLLHHGITGGCGGTDYCPAFAATREQMAVFVLIAKEGPGYAPPACTTPVFNDVPAASPFCRFIEELVRRGVVSGCGSNLYCPTNPVTREQMAVFVLRTLDPALNPPACGVPVFADVPASSPFCRWIEELARRGVVSGCGGGNYCPTSPVTREQMGVFISVSFGLALYGP